MKQNIITLLAIVLMIPFANAQLSNTPTSKSFGFGVLMSLDYDYVKTENSNWEALGINTDLQTLETQNKMGFSLGLIYRLQLSERFAVVPQTLLSFQDNRLNYTLENQTTHEESLEAALLAVPLHFVFTDVKGEKYNPAITIGGRYTYDISDKNEDALLNVKKHDFAVDLGVGLEVKMKKFAMKPQLMYTFGLANLKDGNATIYNQAISHISRDKIALRFLFYAL